MRESAPVSTIFLERGQVWPLPLCIPARRIMSVKSLMEMVVKHTNWHILHFIGPGSHFCDRLGWIYLTRLSFVAYFRQSRRPRGTSSAVLSFWELSDARISHLITGIGIFHCAVCSWLPIANIYKGCLPMLAAFWGNARDRGLARCPLLD